MAQNLRIAGYCRISVDEELDRDNTSIENQKSIIADFVSRKFPGSELDFYVDRDRSGYTFEQREGYQRMRPLLLRGHYQILVVKDFSRFSRRNSRGLVELEDLRDAGLRILSIGDSIDYPTYDDWTAIQFRFLINEMPVTDASKKVRSVIKRRQADGRWICSVPYGYVLTNPKTMTIAVDEAQAQVVRKIFELYRDGWGYKKIANYLTDQHIPTPRMTEQERKLSAGEEYRREVRPIWSIVTVQGILDNDFYIGTLRQGKYTRKKINGADQKKDESEHIVFKNHHEPIVDARLFSAVQEARKTRTRSNYRGIKKYDNPYSGYLFCGDCGSPMFSMSRRDLKPAYTCGAYHRRGTAGCSSHHIRTDTLDAVLKGYIRKVKNNSAFMLEQLEQELQAESTILQNSEQTGFTLQKRLDDAYEELKATKRMRIRDLMKHPDREDVLEQTYDELEAEITSRISGLQHQLELNADRRNTLLQVSRTARTALDIFDAILNKDKLDKVDLSLLLERILVYEDHIEVNLKADIDDILRRGLDTLPPEVTANFPEDIVDISQTQAVQTAQNRRDKVYGVNIISSGSPSRIRMVLRISLGMTTRPKSSMRRTIPVAFIVFKTFQLWVELALEVLSARYERLFWKNYAAKSAPCGALFLIQTTFSNSL